MVCANEEREEALRQARDLANSSGLCADDGRLEIYGQDVSESGWEELAGGLDLTCYGMAAVHPITQARVTIRTNFGMRLRDQVTWRSFLQQGLRSGVKAVAP